MIARRRRTTLVADIGGTNARFAFVVDGELDQVRSFSCAEHTSLTAAVETYLEAVGGPRPQRAIFAVAGPVDDGAVEMTNHIWRFSSQAVCRDLGLEHLEVINDFAALALAIPALEGDDLKTLKEGMPVPRQPIALLGPGTGLGVAALIPTREGWVPISTEGGHRDLVAQTEREWQIVRRLRERFGHVSVERVLSGSGLVNLYETIAWLGGSEPQVLTASAVEAGARQRSSPECVEALALFSGWLGAVAGDLALTFGAKGGVYIGGGILPKLGSVFDVDRFRERFLDKGRFRDYLRHVPVHSIVREHAALLGLARAL